MALLFGTGRAALRSPIGLGSPLHKVLRNPATRRTMATVFERNKPHVNIGEYNASFAFVEYNVARLKPFADMI